MNNPPLISVIIPNYCHAKFLDQRIMTVLGQTYKNLEVIILDDASPDDGASKAVIEKYRNNPYVCHIVYNEHNSGSTFKQWYKGLQLAKGEFCWIAESDDYCELDFLEKLLSSISNYPNVVFSTCSTQGVDERGNYLQRSPFQEKSELLYRGGDFIHDKMMCGNGIWNASSTIFKLESAKEIDQQYMNFEVVGDRLFWIKLAEKGNVVSYNGFLNYCRLHNNRTSTIKTLKGITSKEDFRVVRYLEKKGYVRFIERLIIRDKYLGDIDNTQFESEAIRKELTKLWTFNGLVPRRLMRLLLYFFYKLSLLG